jgi:hypothetical protein
MWNRKRNEISCLKAMLEKRTDEIANLNHRLKQLEGENRLKYGFTIREDVDGKYVWHTWKEQWSLSSYGHGGPSRVIENNYTNKATGENYPSGSAKTAYSAELKARKALVPFQTKVTSITKKVC